MKKILVSLMLLLLPCVYLQAKISGTYKVRGVNPFTHHKYRGVVTIERHGETYNALWTFSDGTHDAGTGLRQGNQISFVFTSPDVPDSISGVQVYEIKANCLKGPWTVLGADKAGFESLNKIDR